MVQFITLYKAVPMAYLNLIHVLAVRRVKHCNVCWVGRPQAVQGFCLLTEYGNNVWTLNTLQVQ